MLLQNDKYIYNTYNPFFILPHWRVQWQQKLTCCVCFISSSACRLSPKSPCIKGEKNFGNIPVGANSWFFRGICKRGNSVPCGDESLHLTCLSGGTSGMRFLEVCTVFLRQFLEFIPTRIPRLLAWCIPICRCEISPPLIIMPSSRAL